MLTLSLSTVVIAGLYVVGNDTECGKSTSENSTNSGDSSSGEETSAVGGAPVRVDMGIVAVLPVVLVVTLMTTHL